jgi:hypothetical protein
LRKCLVIAVMIAASLTGSLVQAAGRNPLPLVVAKAQDYTPSGDPRQFPAEGGYLAWSPRMPVYSGDLVGVDYSLSDGSPMRDLQVFLDGKSLTHVTKPPWSVSIDTKKLEPGKHVISGEVRTRTQPIMYGTTKVEFYVQKQPATMVAGSIEELTGGAKPQAVTTTPVVDPNIKVKLRSLDPYLDRQLAGGGPIVINRPATVYLEGNAQRWAYSITRNGTVVTSAGPIAQRIYVRLAPKTATEPGLIAGDHMLKVWGVGNDGAYSEPITVPLQVR